MDLDTGIYHFDEGTGRSNISWITFGENSITLNHRRISGIGDLGSCYIYSVTYEKDYQGELEIAESTSYSIERAYSSEELKIYEEPLVDSPQLGRIEPIEWLDFGDFHGGTEFSILEKESELRRGSAERTWYRIRVENTTGWIHAGSIAYYDAYSF